MLESLVFASNSRGSDTIVGDCVIEVGAEFVDFSGMDAAALPTEPVLNTGWVWAAAEMAAAK